MINTITDLKLADIVSAWQSRRQWTPRGVRFMQYILQTLAKGQPVSAESVALNTEHTLGEVQDYFLRLKSSGAEFDQAGNLIGETLTLKPTNHRFRSNDQELYAWCSLDTLFLAGLLGQTAEVESTCPTTGETIRFTVTPDGVENLTPSTAVTSIVVPGITQNLSCAPGKTAPESGLCGQMHFFITPQAATEWLQQHPDVTYLTVEDAFELGRQVWVQPWAKAQNQQPTQAIQIDSKDQAACCGASCC